MNRIELGVGDSGDKSLVILQSLLCLLREKNLLTRADIEELREKVEARASDHAGDPLPCCIEGAAAAAAVGTAVSTAESERSRRRVGAPLHV